MSARKLPELEITWKAREPMLSERSLEALRTAAGLPFRSVTVPRSILEAVLNDRDDWVDAAEKLQDELTKERTLSGELGATVEALREELDEEPAR